MFALVESAVLNLYVGKIVPLLFLCLGKLLVSVPAKIHLASFLGCRLT